MIDMVVHRHKMRETLVRICQMLMVPVAAPKSADKTRSKRLNGQPYVNGHATDTQVIEAGAPPTVEPEILGPEERFDASRLETRDKPRKDEEADTTGRSKSKDGRHP
jgi:acetyl-CoA carboxylase carboxyl transferase subunit beta